MDDNFLYKVRSAHADLIYYAKVIRKEGLNSVLENETKKIEVKKRLIEIARSVEYIQTQMGDPVGQEFKDVEIQ